MPRQLEFWEDEKTGEEITPPSPEMSFKGELAKEAAPVKEEGMPCLSRKAEGKKAGTVPGAKAVDPAAVEALRGELCRLSGLEVHIKITNNAHCMMRVVHEPGGRSARLSVHWMFLDAPQAVVKSLAGWVKCPRKLRKDSVLRCYMRENNDRIPDVSPRRVTICTKGRHHDLAGLYAGVNAAEFGGAVNARITWGVMLPVGGSRSGHLRLGSFNDRQNLIRIHPVLDDSEVPAFVVRSIVFHEMLHAFLGIGKEDGKRRKVHHAAFREREREYRDHAASEAWIANPANMRMLIRTRKNGATSRRRPHSDL